MNKNKIKYILIAILGIIIVVGMVYFILIRNDEILRNKSNILEGIENKPYEEKIVIIENKLKEDPTNYILSTEYAGLKRNRDGYTEEVVSDIEKAYALNPDYYLANTEKGKIEFKKGNYDKAIEYFKISLEKGHDYNTDPKALIGISYIKKQNYDEGFLNLEEALINHPNSNYWRYELIKGYYEKKDYENAKKHIKILLESPDTEFRTEAKGISNLIETNAPYEEYEKTYK